MAPGLAAGGAGLQRPLGREHPKPRPSARLAGVPGLVPSGAFGGVHVGHGPGRVECRPAGEGDRPGATSVAGAAGRRGRCHGAGADEHRGPQRCLRRTVGPVVPGLQANRRRPGPSLAGLVARVQLRSHLAPGCSGRWGPGAPTDGCWAGVWLVLQPGTQPDAGVLRALRAGAEHGPIAGASHDRRPAVSAGRGGRPWHWNWPGAPPRQWRAGHREGPSCRAPQPARPAGSAPVTRAQPPAPGRGSPGGGGRHHRSRPPLGLRWSRSQLGSGGCGPAGAPQRQGPGRSPLRDSSARRRRSGGWLAAGASASSSPLSMAGVWRDGDD